MDKQNNEKKDKINDVVKSRIKGLGLDALFHQVDKTQKDPGRKKHHMPDDEELRLMQKIEKGTPLFSAGKIPRFIDNLLANINAGKTDNRIILDIGSSNIKIIVLKSEKDRTLLQDAVFIPIPHIVTTTRDRLNDFIKKTLQPVANSPLFKNSEVTSIVSAGSMIIKFISLPSTQKQEIEKMLNFEAEQHLPFPLDEIETDHQIISQEPPQSKVMLIAAKKTMIKEHLELLASFGVYPDRLVPSSVALYNAGLSPSKKDGICLQVHIGASDTEINIIQNNRLCFCRTIDLGSQDLTLRLSKNLNLSFDNAQKLKHENGIIITKKQANQIETDISAVSAKWADEIAFEIKRTIEAFQIDHGKNEIQQAGLSGGGANLLNLNEYLREKLKIKIVMEKNRQPECNSNAVETYYRHFQEFHLISSSFAHDPGEVKINLVPRQIKQNINLKKQRIKQAVFTAAGFLVLLLLFALPALILSLRQSRIRQLDQNLTALEQELFLVKDIQQKIGSINDYIDVENSCMEVLRQISLIMPADITVNDFAFEKGESVILSGIARSHSSVVNLSQLLNDSPVFKEGKIMYTRKKGSLNEEAVDFEIYCGIKNSEGQ